MYKLNTYVLVTDQSSELFRRRCKIQAIQEGTNSTLKYTVYSEGLELAETLPEEALQLSPYQG